MGKRYVMLAFSLLLAAAVAVPALGQSSDPTATTSASAKTIAKKAKKKANNALTAANEAQSAANNALNAANSAQSSANNAQSAANNAQSSANNALAREERFSYETNATATTTTLFQGGGLQIEASCAAGTLDINARSLADNSIIHVGTIDNADTANYDEDDDFDNNETENLDADAVSDSVQGTFTFRNGGNPTVITGTYLLEEDGFQGLDCAAFGNVEIL
jgi:hypothetical protein